MQAHTATAGQPVAGKRVNLPTPVSFGGLSINDVLQKRRSVRRYGHGKLTLGEVSQLLWAAQGLSSREGYRTAPSAGALYGLEIHLAAGNVAELDVGVYRYQPVDHRLIQRATTDHRSSLATAALGQNWLGQGAAVLVVSAVYSRISAKYGARGVRYAHLEAGHAAQNVLLMATSLDLGAVPVGAFDDAGVASVLKLDESEQPLYLIPVGRR
jgi:SagB-type dehydrogenase family enzyme